MRAQVIQQFGGPEVFESVEVPTPAPGRGEALVRVVATSVNPLDVLLRKGAFPTLVPRFPAVLHGDVAGVVEAVGPGVEGLVPGDAVYGVGGGLAGIGGALAEHMVVDAALLAPAPHRLALVEAAALPLVAITAWLAVVERAKVSEGQKVLVLGGTGGVGHVAVQLARWRGARVFATASSAAKLRLARELGADVVIDHAADHAATAVERHVAEHTGGDGFDVVIDTVGGEVLDTAFAATRRNGTVVTINALSARNLSPLHLKSLTLHAVFMLLPLLYGEGRRAQADILRRVAELVDAGTLRPLIDERRLRISEVGEAHRLAESGRAVGKILLVA